MGAHEDELRRIAASSAFAIPGIEELHAQLVDVSSELGKVAGSVGWKGISAGNAQEALDTHKRAFATMADAVDDIRRAVDRANEHRRVAISQLNDLPSTVVDPAYAQAAREATEAKIENVQVGLVLVPAAEVVGFVTRLLNSQRESEAEKALDDLRSKLQAEKNAIDASLGLYSQALPEFKNLEIDDPGPAGPGSSTTIGGGAYPGPGGYVPSGPGITTTTPSYPGYPGPGAPVPPGDGGTGGGGGGGGLGPDSPINPTDPRAPVTPGSPLPGGIPGGGGAGGSGGGAGLGVGGGVGAGLIGAGAIGAGVKLAGGGAGGSIMGGAGGMGSAGAGAGRLGSGGLAGAAGLGGAGSAAGSAGASSGAGAAGGARGGMGVMGMGGQGAGSDEKQRARGLGGIVAPKLVDDEELGPRSTAAGAGGRDELSAD